MHLMENVVCHPWSRSDSKSDRGEQNAVHLSLDITSDNIPISRRRISVGLPARLDVVEPPGVLNSTFHILESCGLVKSEQYPRLGDFNADCLRLQGEDFIKVCE